MWPVTQWPPIRSPRRNDRSRLTPRRRRARAERRARERLGAGEHRVRVARRLGHGQARAVVADRFADRELADRQRAGRIASTSASLRRSRADDRPDVFDEPGEHALVYHGRRAMTRKSSPSRTGSPTSSNRGARASAATPAPPTQLGAGPPTIVGAMYSTSWSASRPRAAPRGARRRPRRAPTSRPRRRAASRARATEHDRRGSPGTARSPRRRSTLRAGTRSVVATIDACAAREAASRSPACAA